MLQKMGGRYVMAADALTFFLNQFSRHYGAISCVTHTAIEKNTEEDAEKQ
jgi:hypothetical protein